MQITAIVPEESVDAANPWAFEHMGADFGDACLSTDGKSPATHCWASAEVKASALPGLMASASELGVQVFVQLKPRFALALMRLKEVS